jgi:hypothetical protein
MANTNILIKRAGVSGNGVPSSLQAGELAYSYASNTIFIGSPAGTGVVNVGGQYYTSQIDEATDSATANKLVRRDATGNASFNYISANIIGTIQGTANSALQLQNSRDFAISGSDITASAVGFNGLSNVTLNASLNAVPGLSAAEYGNTSFVPVITVAANGRVIAATTAAVSFGNIRFSDQAGNKSTITANGSTIGFIGNTDVNPGIVTSTTIFASNPAIQFRVDDTVVRSNSFTGGTQTINTNLTIGSNNNLTVTGNLIVQGNVISQNVQQFAVQDPLIVLGIGNYYSDTLDIGFAAHYNDGANAMTGLIRDPGDKEYHFFKDYTAAVDANNNINLSDASYREANVNASYFKGNLIATTINVSGLSTVANVIPTGNNSQSLGSITNRFKEGHFKDLFVSGSSVSLDGALLKSTLTGNEGGSSFGTGGIELRPANLATSIMPGDLIKLGPVARYSACSTTQFSAGSLFQANNIFATDGSVAFGLGSTNSFIGTIKQTNGNFVLLSSSDTSACTTGTVIGAGTAPGGMTVMGSFVSTSNVIATGQSFAAGRIAMINTGGQITSLANSNYSLTGTLSNTNTITSLTVDAYGRVTAATGSKIEVDLGGNSTTIVNKLPVAYGGTGQETFPVGQILVGDGQNKILSLANSTYTATGTGAANNTVSSLTVDAYGRVTAATFSAISGLTVAQGGTGLSTITQNGITYGNGTGNLGVTAAAGTSDQTFSNQILTVTNAGVPVWSTTLDGGQF